MSGSYVMSPTIKDISDYSYIFSHIFIFFNNNQHQNIFTFFYFLYHINNFYYYLNKNKLTIIQFFFYFIITMFFTIICYANYGFVCLATLQNSIVHILFFFFNIFYY
jgi:hypothetical protein